MEVTVAIATDEERQVLWERLVARAPFFAKYQAKMVAARIRVVPCEGSSAGQVAGAESTSDSWLWGALSTPWQRCPAAGRASAVGHRVSKDWSRVRRERPG